jgi:hypothetical protein
MVAYSPHILVVHPSVPAKSVAELVALAKSKPGKLNYAASSTGSAPHLAGVEFAQRAKIDWNYIPYKGGAQAITDVVGGQADLLFNGMLATYPNVKGGKLRILAVSSANRLASIPDVPRLPKAAFRDSRRGRGRAFWRRPARRRDRGQARQRSAEDPRDAGDEGEARGAGRGRARDDRRGAFGLHFEGARSLGEGRKEAGIKAE